jgi:hypothetical protein
MTVTKLHPSEITFACPPWCRIARGEHLEQIGEGEGKVTHYSPDVEGDGWIVSLSSVTYPDGTQADDEGTLVEIDASSVNLTPDKARALVQALIAATAEAER